MKSMRLGLLAIAVLLSMGTADAAWALDHDSTGAHAGANGFIISGYNAANATDQQESQVVSSASSGHWVTTPVCSFGGAGLCNDVALCQDGTPMTQATYVSETGRQGDSYIACPSATAAAAPPQPQITNALVLRALRRVDLPSSQLEVQPPGGETLVNFRTNFFTRQGAFTRSVQLLGRRVDLQIWPSRFHWVFGDGGDLASTSAGSPYPDLEITHSYESRGAVSPSVDTTYSARYRVDGGPWRDVVGTVTIPGSPVRLEVRTARPVLVSYH